MDDELRLVSEKVLKQETKWFLDEIDHLMEEDGVGRLLEMGGNKIPGKSQFKSLMDAASEASCIEELVLFLSYQESKKEGWEKECKNECSIARNVINSFTKILDGIYLQIEEMCKEQKINDDDERILRLKIAEKYMGYLYWKACTLSRKE